MVTSRNIQPILAKCVMFLVLSALETQALALLATILTTFTIVLV